MIKRFIALLTLAMLVFSLGAFASDDATTEYNGNEYATKTQIWDIDFEEAQILSHSDIILSVADSKGEEIHNEAKDYMGINTGSAESIVEIVKNEKALNKDNGKSVHMKSGNSTDNVQFNNLLTTTIGESVVVYELDVCVSDFKAEKNFHPQYYTNGGKSKVWGKQVRILKDGNFNFGGNNIKAELNTWYRLKLIVDIPSSKEVCYIDDKYLGEESIDTTDFYGMFKLSINFKNAPSEMWVDNFKMYELTPLPEISTAECGADYVDVGFSVPVDKAYFMGEDGIKNFSAVCEKTEMEFLDCTRVEGKENTLRFTSSKAFPTGAGLDLSINYYGVSVNGSVSTQTSDFDVANVSVTKDKSTFSASAQCINKTETRATIIMMLVLFDDAGTVVGIDASPAAEHTDGKELSAVCTSDKATNAYVYFMTDWTSLKAFKNIIYYLK